MAEYEIGINYEGGKIINHILKFDNCVGYVNCQITMDAPYHTVPRIADEKVRSSGRSESQFTGYNELKLQSDLRMIFEYIKENYPDTKIVIQMARGRSAQPTITEVISPVLDDLKITLVEFVLGYHTENYYVPDKTQFIFFNYGMFAELSENLTLHAGCICNPVVTYEIDSYDDTDGFHILKNKSVHAYKNILNLFKFPKLILYGLDEEMPFVTPDVYRKKFIKKQLCVC
jgi:hypothetical protein